MPSKEVLEQIKAKYLAENNLEEKCVESKEKASAQIEQIDVENDEVWLMQCPKHVDLAQLKGHKIKFPGRTIESDLDLMVVAYPNKARKALGYAVSGSNKVHLLPISGSIVVRKKLEGHIDVNAAQIQAASQHAARPRLPILTKQRHPLFGADFEKKLKPRKCISKRLCNADKLSTDITKVARQQQMTSRRRTVKKEQSYECPSESTTVVHSEHVPIKQEVSEDLKWLVNI